MTTDTTFAAAGKSPALDEALSAAWLRHIQASIDYSLLPFSDCPGGGYTPAEQVEIDKIDAAEKDILETPATSPAGIEIKLWIALGHTLTEREESAAAMRGDLAWFIQRERDFDWPDRFILSAISSLRAIGGAA